MATEYNKTAQPLFDLENVVGQLAAVRQEWRAAQQRSNEPGGRELPSRDALADILRGLKGVLFPMRLGPTDLRQESAAAIRARDAPHPLEPAQRPRARQSRSDF